MEMDAGEIILRLEHLELLAQFPPGKEGLIAHAEIQVKRRLLRGNRPGCRSRPKVSRRWVKVRSPG